MQANTIRHLVTLLSLAAALAVPAPCRGQPADMPASRREAMMARSPFNEIEPPESARPGGSGARGGGGGSEEWYQRLDTDLSAAEVASHYAVELAERGWERGTAAVEGSVALRTFQRVDDEGQAWHALLFVAEEAPRPGHVTVLLRQTLLAGGG